MFAYLTKHHFHMQNLGGTRTCWSTPVLVSAIEQMYCSSGWGNLQPGETEEVTWMVDETFLPHTKSRTQATFWDNKSTVRHQKLHEKMQMNHCLSLMFKSGSLLTVDRNPPTQFTDTCNKQGCVYTGAWGVLDHVYFKPSIKTKIRFEVKWHLTWH